MAADTAASYQSIQPLSTSDQLAKLQDYCRRLNQALEAERAKSSKLRQYIARLNNSRTRPDAAPHTQTALQALVEDQTRLIEQLYAENEQHRAQMADLERKNQQLTTANNKFKARNIDLRRRLRISADTETQEVPCITQCTAAREEDVISENVKSRSLFKLRLPLTKSI